MPLRDEAIVSGRYRIVRPIGNGGMGTVFAGIDLKRNIPIAIKLLNPPTKVVQNTTAFIAQLEHEVRMLRQLSHPNIISLYDASFDTDIKYIVMELAKTSLRSHIEQHAPIATAQVLEYGIEIADALTRAHHLSIIHRDLKPENILIAPDGTLRIADFGLATPIQQNNLDDQCDIGGTLYYLSPEAIRSEKLDERADVWAFGVLLYEMLTGLRPFRAQSVPVLLSSILHDPPKPPLNSLRPDLPLALQTLVDSMLAKEKDARINSMRLIGAALEFVQKSSLNGGTLNPSDRIIAQAGQVPLLFPNHTPVRAAPQKRHVTVLTVNVASLLEIMEANENAGHETRIALWSTMTQLVQQFNGIIDTINSNALIAVWGAFKSTEHDVQHAVQAALAVFDAVKMVIDDHQLENLPVQAAIHTGMGTVENSSVDDSLVSGTSISIATRLEHQTPPGHIAITHDTYRHIRGIFTVKPAAPLKVYGREEALRVYHVQYMKELPFHRVSRSVIGNETRMMGRREELALLQAKFHEAFYQRDAQIVTIVGAPGIGKSRLLFEYSDWADLQTLDYWLFRGRGLLQHANQPYALLRDILRSRFSIQDNEPVPNVLDKVEREIASFVQNKRVNNRKMAELIGNLIGFDLTDATANDTYQRGNRDLHHPVATTIEQRALTALRTLFVSAEAESPVLIEIEDMHWADEASLLFLRSLIENHANSRFLLVCTARPAMLTTYPFWGSTTAAHTILKLRPLDQANIRGLVEEIMGNMQTIPSQFIDDVVNFAAGNPLYVEEMIKMHLEEHILFRRNDRWELHRHYSQNRTVPATLMGLLQARLDILSPVERDIATRASIIGRIFWDTAITSLADEHTSSEIQFALQRLMQRELIFLRPDPEFTDCREYIFKHDLLCDALYHGCLPAQRRKLHANAARWLEQSSGDRKHEYALQIAQHLTLSDDPNAALPFFIMAANLAMEKNTPLKAKSIAETALSSVTEQSAHYPYLRWLHTRACGLTMSMPPEAQVVRLQDALQQAMHFGQQSLVIDILWSLGTLYVLQGYEQRAIECLETALAQARKIDYPNYGHLLVYVALTHLMVRQNIHYAASLLDEAEQVAVASNNQPLLVSVYGRKGLVASLRKTYDDAIQCYTQAIKLGHEFGLWWSRALSENNLGEVYRLQGNLAAAEKCYFAALATFRQHQPLYWKQTVMPLNIGMIKLATHELADAKQWFMLVLQHSVEQAIIPRMLSGLIGFAAITGRENTDMDAKTTAVMWMALAVEHAQCNYESQLEAQPYIQELQACMSKQSFDAAWQHGKTLDPTRIAQNILENNSAGVMDI